MKVKILSGSIGNNRTQYYKGEIHDVEDSIGTHWLKEGYVELVKERVLDKSIEDITSSGEAHIIEPTTDATKHKKSTWKRK